MKKIENGKIRKVYWICKRWKGIPFPPGDFWDGPFKSQAAAEKRLKMKEHYDDDFYFSVVELSHREVSRGENKKHYD
jgi:hypothetical protein